MKRDLKFRFKVAYAAIGLLLLWVVPFAIEWFHIHALGAPSPFRAISPVHSYFLLGVFVVSFWLAIEALAWVSRRTRLLDAHSNRPKNERARTQLEEGIEIEIAERKAERRSNGVGTP